MIKYAVSEDLMKLMPVLKISVNAAVGSLTESSVSSSLREMKANAVGYLAVTAKDNSPTGAPSLHKLHQYQAKHIIILPEKYCSNRKEKKNDRIEYLLPPRKSMEGEK